MTDEKTVNFSTMCSSCVFAQTDEAGIQNGCDLDKLKIYQQNGLTQLDNETNHFIINTICNTCRGQKWADSKLGYNLIAEVEKETKIRFDFILLAIDVDMIKIERRLPDVLNQCISQNKIKPQNINIVIRGIDISVSKIREIINEFYCDNIKCNITRIFDLSLSKDECINSAMKQCAAQYCGIFNLCDNIPSNLICVLNRLINVDLKTINMVVPFSDFSGLIIQPSLYKLFGGNRNFKIYDKIQEAASIQNKEKNIYKWEELWIPE